ncbi:MAG: hypothetical protein RIA10_01270 [Amphiplicatus sp.]
MNRMRTADMIHGGAAGAILIILLAAIGFMLAQAIGGLAADFQELNRRSVRIEALELRLQESQEASAATLHRLGATPGDLPLLEEPARLRAHLETICSVFDADTASAPCVIEERPLTEGLSEYSARRSGRGDLGAFAACVIEALAPPAQARVLTVRGGAGPASQRLEIEARLIGAASRAPSENASTETDSES